MKPLRMNPEERRGILTLLIIITTIAAWRLVGCSTDEQDALPRDDDGYCYINTLERCFHCDTLEQLESSNQYDKIKNCIDVELSGYADGRVREKYLWLRKELRRIEKELALKEGAIVL